MKPTTPDATPRRDGWFEHQGTWGEVTVGTVLADVSLRSKRWEVIDTAHGPQIPFGMTLWMRAREQTTGEEFTIQPRYKNAAVTILTRDPEDTQTPPVTPAADSDAILLLVEKLGATLMASRDEATGEITCPDYLDETHREDGRMLLGLVEHMRIAHGMKIDAGITLADATTLHGQAHNLRKSVGKGGFPHRHVPEDLKLITGIDRR